MRYRTLAALMLCVPTVACAQTMPTTMPTTVEARVDTPAPELYDRVRKSLVAVQYTWESELGRREVVGAGVVVSDDGLVMTPLAMFDLRIPDGQMKEFKLLVPSDTGDAEELEAVFLGRDERSDLAFVKAKVARKWQPVKFVNRELRIGEPLWSVGLLPKMAGYKAYICPSQVSAKLRGEIRQTLVSGGLAAVGSPVLDVTGNAVGFVNSQVEQPIILNEPKLGMMAVSRPPMFFVTADQLQASIADPPTGEGLKLPWLGVMQLVGLKKEVTEYFGLGSQPAVQLGDIIPGGPAAEAGLKPGDIIVKVNGQELTRGDEVEELPMILRRELLRMKVDSPVILGVMDQRTRKSRQVTVKLQARPTQPHQAKRYYAEDLGFAVRELVFMDSYARHLPPETQGVLVALVRPQSAAQGARLENNDMIVELNGQAVEGFEAFTKAYQAFRKEKAKEAVVLVVLREGKNQTIRIEPPQ